MTYERYYSYEHALVYEESHKHKLFSISKHTKIILCKKCRDRLFTELQEDIKHEESIRRKKEKTEWI